MKRYTMKPLILLAAMVLCLSFGTTGAGPNGNPNPGVIPPNADARGKSYGEWAQAWWTWAVSMSAAENPMFVDSNDAAHLNQTEKVFFLCGAQDGVHHERSVTVKPGTPLFFPILNALWWAPDDLATAAALAAGVGLDPLTMTDEELLRFVAEYSMQAYPGQSPPTMSVVVDGKAVADLVDYRAVSPDLFSIADTDLLGDLPGRTYVADGYWVLLNPLPPGEHTIEIDGTCTEGPFAGFVVDVTYNLTVAN